MLLYRLILFASYYDLKNHIGCLSLSWDPLFISLHTSNSSIGYN